MSWPAGARRHGPGGRAGRIDSRISRVPNRADGRSFPSRHRHRRTASWRPADCRTWHWCRYPSACPGRCRENEGGTCCSQPHRWLSAVRKRAPAALSAQCALCAFQSGFLFRWIDVCSWTVLGDLGYKDLLLARGAGRPLIAFAGPAAPGVYLNLHRSRARLRDRLVLRRSTDCEAESLGLSRNGPLDNWRI